MWRQYIFFLYSSFLFICIIVKSGEKSETSHFTTFKRIALKYFEIKFSLKRNSTKLIFWTQELNERNGKNMGIFKKKIYIKKNQNPCLPFNSFKNNIKGDIFSSYKIFSCNYLSDVCTYITQSNKLLLLLLLQKLMKRNALKKCYLN